ncbi:MAG TPA: serine hydrolase domain-containing protein [Methylomirabilota bacterium]|jgi:CubicO group peptidase (beta-lactamase class C family)|nr:serine hydrolase domain-containing protein [Methylomirabilota bacterium]
MSSLRPIDAVLREAAESGQVPGVVAMAATDRGPLYEGAFGRRALDGPEPMTLDSVFRIASMTKAITSVAAMQLVEQGKLALEAPVPDIDPTLGAPRVLEGFDAAGKPRLRPARRPITLRHLLTHTAGFGYDMWDPAVGRYLETAGLPARGGGHVASIRLPLVFDPGERWEYGINTDWVGRLVEAASGRPLDAYFRERIFGPLGMADSGYVTTTEQRGRQARLHERQADGSLLLQPLEPPAAAAEFWSGGGPLYSTGRDYLQLLQMLLHRGSWNGTRLLRAETVALMGQNHTGDLPAGVMKTARPEMSYDVDFFPGARIRWGLGYMLNLEPGPNGRSAGTVSWGGIFNTYYWLDPVRRVTGLIMTQILPFADPRVLALYGRFERAVYEALPGA